MLRRGSRVDWKQMDTHTMKLTKNQLQEKGDSVHWKNWKTAYLFSLGSENMIGEKCFSLWIQGRNVGQEKKTNKKVFVG